MICLSFTAPAIVVSPAIPYLKVEQLLIPVIVAIYIWLLLAGVARLIRFNAMFLVGGLYCTCNLFSIAYGDAILGHPVDLRDYYELPKVWLPVAFFTIAYEAQLSESSLRRLMACFSSAVLLVCSYAWAQFFDLSFTYKLNAYYTTSRHIESALEYARRVYATVGNANVLAQLMTWCVVLLALAALFRAGSRLLYSLLAFACIITLVMTGSRYGVLTLAVGLSLILAFAARRSLPKLAFTFMLIPLVALPYLIIAKTNTRTLQRYQTLRDPLHIDSLRERVDEVWPPAWSQFTQSPLVGHGPGKSFLWVGASVPSYLDSEYLKVLREEGSIGFVIYLGYYLYPLYAIRKGQRVARALDHQQEKNARANIVVVHASFIMAILAFIMNVGMETFYMPFLQGFLWLWLGLGARSAVTIRRSLAASELCVPQIGPSSSTACC